jgi:hypothetical protein
MANINWDKGQLITLTEGDTARALNLNESQLYGLFFYNSAGADADTVVDVVWSNRQPPKPVTVPGTTQGQGLASILFVSGGDTTAVSAAVTQGNPGAEVTAFICSVKMPIDGGGLNNRSLPSDGQPQRFEQFTRFYSVPESHWYDVRIQSDINQFIVVQFTEARALVLVVNRLVDPSVDVQAVGQAVNMFTIQTSTTQSIDADMQGNGRQVVWINADSVQNSQNATIAYQSLSRTVAPQPRKEAVHRATTGV